MKERRACPDCGGDVEKGWVPDAWYCPVCGDVVTFDGDADEGAEEEAT